MTILHIDSSISGEQSATRALTRSIVDQLKASQWGEEVVYRDECWLRVYGGKDGHTVFAQVVSSGTCLEYPVIADVDNGYGNVVNVVRTVREYERAGIAGICMEDNVFPKKCSLYPGMKRELLSGASKLLIRRLQPPDGRRGKEGEDDGKRHRPT